MKRKTLFSFILALLMAFQTAAPTLAAQSEDGVLIVKDGML